MGLSYYPRIFRGYVYPGDSHLSFRHDPGRWHDHWSWLGARHSV